MAKKKKTLSDMVKAPRTIDIKGQKHMLAWITPKEGKTLKALGGAGTPGPMGIPAFIEDEYDPYEGTGTTAAEVLGYDTTSQVEGEEGQERAEGGISQEDFEDLPEYMKNLYDVDEQGRITGKGIHEIERDPRTGRVTGFIHETNPFGIMGGLASILSGGKPILTYTGFGKNPFAASDTSDDPDKPRGPAAPSAPDEPAAPTEMTQAEKDYYARGIGTGTDIPTSEQDIYKSIIGTGTSPIGGRFDREKGLLYLPDGRIINVKTGQEVNKMSGLDIFKPVSTVTT